MTLGDWQWLTEGWTLDCKFQLQQNEVCSLSGMTGWVQEGSLQTDFYQPITNTVLEGNSLCCSAVSQQTADDASSKQSHCSPNTWLLLNSKLHSCRNVSGHQEYVNAHKKNRAAVESKSSWIADAAGPHPWSTHNTASYYREQSTFRLSY